MPSASRCSARIASTARSIDGRRPGNSFLRGVEGAIILPLSLPPGVFMPSLLFQPMTIGEVELSNRLVVAPMCQYSASDGSATDWHLQHLSQLAYSGAGLVMVEATAVERRGRITHACLGLYSDDNEAALERALYPARRLAGPTRFGIQLAHAGRKASTHRPWQGGAPLGSAEDPWQTVSSSATPFGEGWHVPHALTSAEIDATAEAFVQSAHRAVRLGFDVIEIHS